MIQNVGIHGIGVYLPEQVRTNSYWPEDKVAAWRDRAKQRLERIAAMYAEAPTEGARAVLKAMLELGSDPFQGGTERRSMLPTMAASEMETAAAREAISRSGVDPKEIDLVMSYTLTPDFINSPQACLIHHQLGLNEKCMTLATDAVCNSFMMQLSLAASMILSGRVRYALLVQSSAITRIAESGENYDTWFGDAATAAVVGRVSESRGILGYSHFTDGSLYKALVCGVPGKRWFDQGEIVAYSEDHASNYNMCVLIADRAKQVVEEALAEAGLLPGQVDFYACHQAFLWLREITQNYIGMKNARSVDTFKWAGTVSAANLPLVLALGERDGLLKDGQSVAMFQGGTGVTCSGMVLRWGR